MDDAGDRLAREAEYFHWRFFRRPAPAQVVERYVAANRLCFPETDDRARRMLEQIVDRRLDVEAVELYLRWRRGDRLLTRKIQILFYLVEVRAAYYADFVNRKPGLARALAALLAGVAGTAWKCIKGWRQGLANDLV